MDESPGASLLGQLRRDAEAAAARCIETARTEASRLRADADERLARHRAVAVAERAQAHAAALERVRSDTRMRTAREWLTARAEALDRVFAAAHETLATRAGDPRFVAAVAGIARDALAYLPPGEAVARCAASLVPAVRGALESPVPGRATVRVVEDETVTTGVVLETADRSLAIDATFARRLARDRPRLAIAVAQKLDMAAS